MERVTKFISRDKQEFLTEKECIAHERRLDFDEAVASFITTRTGLNVVIDENVQALLDSIFKEPAAFEDVLKAAKGEVVKKRKKPKKKAAGSPAQAPLNLHAFAQKRAEEVLAIEDEPERETHLSQLLATDPMLHAMTLEKIEEMSRKAADNDTPPPPAD